jgi:hypothetical protein
MSSNRHDFTTSILASLSAFAAIVVAIHLLAQGSPDHGRDLLGRVLDLMDRFGEGHILPLYAGDGTSGHKLKKD